MNFLKYTPLYFALSGILIIISLISLFLWQLQPAIDFTGGSLIEFQLEQNPDLATIRPFLTQNTSFPISSLQTAQDQKLIIKTEPINQSQINQLQTDLQEHLQQSITLNRFESIGPILGQELLTKMIIAITLTALFILGYIAWTFKNWQYGLSAIIAMLHDSLILVGSFSLLGHFYQVEVDALFITAVLTTLSFSVHDTVVVFDRIRESLKHHQVTPSYNKGGKGRVTFTDLSNKALTETMSRSLNNSLTIIFMLAALLLLGGASLKWFVTALLIGTITGTYSSPFVAVPILTKLKQWTAK